MDTIDIVPIRAFQDNYIWCLRRGTSAVVVDPGDAAPVLAYLSDTGLQLAAILTTHHHGDHVGGNTALLAKYNVPVFGPARESIPGITRKLREGDTVDVPGVGVRLAVLDVPGHTAGHIAYHGEGILFCGDTLFSCGCGRLFEGTAQQMWTSLGKLRALPDNTAIYCAHEYTAANAAFALSVDPDNPALQGYAAEITAKRAKGVPTVPTTIGIERPTNPFLRADVAYLQAAMGHPGDAVATFAEIRERKNRF